LRGRAGATRGARAGAGARAITLLSALRASRLETRTAGGTDQPKEVGSPSENASGL
jgi:hypothetical protein